MSESLNQGWNEAITVLALRGLRGGMSGPLRYLDSTPVLISRAWAWRETTAGPQPKQTDSWSARHAMQRHQVREWSTHTCKHTHMHGSFCCTLCVRQHERMPFHTERWKFPCERQQLQFNNLIKIWLWIRLQHLVSLGLFLYVSSFYMEPRIYMSNKYWLNWWSTILWLGVLTSHHVVLYTGCAAAKLGHDWPSATIVLGPIC